MIGTACFGFAMLGIYVGCNGYIVDSFPEFASSAMASKTLLSRVCGGAFPMFVDRMCTFSRPTCPSPLVFCQWRS